MKKVKHSNILIPCSLGSNNYSGTLLTGTIPYNLTYLPQTNNSVDNNLNDKRKVINSIKFAIILILKKIQGLLINTYWLFINVIAFHNNINAERLNKFGNIHFDDTDTRANNYSLPKLPYYNEIGLFHHHVSSANKIINPHNNNNSIMIMLKYYYSIGILLVSGVFFKMLEKKYKHKINSRELSDCKNAKNNICLKEKDIDSYYNKNYDIETNEREKEEEESLGEDIEMYFNNSGTKKTTSYANNNLPFNSDNKNHDYYHVYKNSYMPTLPLYQGFVSMYSTDRIIKDRDNGSIGIKSFNRFNMFPTLNYSTVINDNIPAVAANNKYEEKIDIFNF
ncbi:uncharacterized protein SCDLUD_003706 [Saccharomycodes ludwigii]|uniref:uncharacterized protein n=1 Tax=Saccharomycodes ludwigii TaxID=36035 RepID=UPI001E8387D6|nr:hypothetical protein SCDLUD_003706 [Saccharomycodes ludwigii]KAH3900705.1 hypothetical protein SCDLUD_003706 [Saccharomycodes ludwigii]